jgi:hypothetical protein
MEPGPLKRLVSHVGHLGLAAGFTTLATLVGWGVLEATRRMDLAIAVPSALGAVAAYAMRERTEAEYKAGSKRLPLWDWSANPSALAGVLWAAAGAALVVLIVAVR